MANETKNEMKHNRKAFTDQGRLLKLNPTLTLADRWFCSH